MIVSKIEILNTIATQLAVIRKQCGQT